MSNYDEEEIEFNQYDDEVEEEIEIDDDQDQEDQEEIYNDEAEEPEQIKEKPIDKKTHAIIKQKQENKRIKEETKLLREKLEQYERAEELKASEARKLEIENKYFDEYLEDGWGEDAARKYAKQMAALEAKQEAIERKQEVSEYRAKAQELSYDYPDISKDLTKLIDICKKTGWTLEKVAIAEYGDRKQTSDSKVKQGMENALKRKITTQASSNTGKISPTLNFQDIEGYKNYKKFNPGVTVEQYKRIVERRTKDPEHFEKIPHDSWD